MVKCLQDFEGHSKEEPDGATSFMYQRRRPFHPERFVQWAKKYWVFADAENVNDAIANMTDAEEQVLDASRSAVFGNPHVLRSRGVVWLASRPRLNLEWTQVGPVAEIRGDKLWFAEVPESTWPQAEGRKAAQKHFQEPFGDRRQEFIFVGQGLKQDAICESLDLCLLDEDELGCYLSVVGDGTRLFKHFRDPLFSWECPSSEDVLMKEIPPLLLPPLRESGLAFRSPSIAKHSSECRDACEGQLASREPHEAEQKSGEQIIAKRPRVHD